MGIAEDQEWKESGELKLTQFGNLFYDAKEKTSEYWLEDVEHLAEYFRFGTSLGPRDDPDLYACIKDTFHVSFDPVKAIALYKLISKEGDGPEVENATKKLGSCYPLELDDAKLSFCWAKSAVAEYGEEKNMSQLHEYSCCPYATLAWHYFYGIGCEKNVEEAKLLMRWTCTINGEYKCPAFIELIKDMGLENELKYNPKLREKNNE